MIENVGKFEIIDEKTGVVLMNNTHLKGASASAGYAHDEEGHQLESSQVYLTLNLTKEGREKLKDISNNYKISYDEAGNDTSKIISVQIDGITVLQTAFSEEYNSDILQFPMGNATTDVSLIAVTVTEEGVIESCAIDAIQGKVAFDAEGQIVTELGEVLSKNELGENYGMKAFSPIGKEWNEQAAAIAAYAEGKTVAELKNGAIDENGVVKDADLASSATIYLGSFVSGIEEAVKNAQYCGASKGDQLVLTAISNGAGSASADGEAVGKAGVASDIIAMTVKGDMITSAIIDSVQSNAEFGTEGVLAEDFAGAVLSKNQLGENYGMKMASSIGKEWNEQAAGFCEYIEKLSEVSGIEIKSAEDVKNALSNRLQFFCELGCRATDHGLDYVVYSPASSFIAPTTILLSVFKPLSSLFCFVSLVILFFKIHNYQKIKGRASKLELKFPIKIFISIIQSK